MTTLVLWSSLLLHIVLFQPEIPPNTGNIIRLCANIGYSLHLVKPLGFPLEDSKLKRAGLDYHEYANLIIHDNWQVCRDYFCNQRIIAIETCGTVNYTQIDYRNGDVLLFGSETKGLPSYVLEQLNKENVARLPMQPSQRSLNLSNSVAIVAYESWRQLHFVGGV